MRRSKYFMPTLKETPKEAEIVSHRYMLRAGMIRQSSAGIYSWLPLGYKVLRNIENIVREEQNLAGCQEMLMPTIQAADLWRKSGRYEDYGPEMLRIVDRHERDLLYGPTNEEVITEVFSSAARSYRDVPRLLYHIQWKFRDEIRPRFGVMRGREFLMKDAYSFDLDEKSAEKSYNKFFVAYLRTFARMHLQAIPMEAATGPIGGKLSHEFIILADTGESEVFCHKDLIEQNILNLNIDYTKDLSPLITDWTKRYARTDEKHEAADFDREVPADKQLKSRGIEVGHIFYFGTKYSEPLGANIAGPDGKEVPVHMGSYGIGVSRLVGAAIEAHHDERGIIWPISIAPFKAGLLNLSPREEKCIGVCESLYTQFQNAGIEVLYDERDERAGEKFAEMDLIGLPWQILVGSKGLARNAVEFKNRKTGKVEEVPLDRAPVFLLEQIG